MLLGSGQADVFSLPGALPKLPPGPQLSHPRQGVKEFKCEVCGREFTLQANMKRHMLIHTSVRPYQCHICFKTFVQKQTLKTHMIVHSPVKPFKCKVPAGPGGWWSWGWESTGPALLCPRNLARLSTWAWRQLCDASPARLGMEYLLQAVTGALLLLK